MSVACNASPVKKSDFPQSPERQLLERIVQQYTGPHIVTIREGLYAAVGYGVSNMILVDTGDGLVIIDTTDNQRVARKVLDDFKAISKASVKAIVYTHSHPDHILGCKAIYEKGVQVYAHESFIRELSLQGQLGMSGAQRGAAMFGAMLLQSERVAPNISAYPSPVAVQFIFEPVKPDSIVKPTEMFAGNTASFTVGGVEFTLYHTPGETPDHTVVHIRQMDAVACGDIFYPSFPNLYTIRGCSPRPVQDWAEAQNRIIALQPEYLLQGHGFPVRGKAEIKTVLSHYREAIQHVHNVALEAVQGFLPVDEAVQKACLPDHLAHLPYLIQSYGCVPYSVKSIINSYVGWFDGNPTNLSPLSRGELANEVIALAGSADKVLNHAEKAQQQGRHQAALELCEMILAGDPRNEKARKLRVHSLLALSYWTANGPTANYYRSFAEKQMIE
ncbi:MAG: alkyl/aryl-sulfatase [Desulfobulbus sp.]|jgi:alkyl sulfatase BDS1-like metallo-beta-lactamase superfamily hydrolase|uniref:alkyl/aryl-sulfatase n=1 Tax=Desulfobulbus sp. TaxID=895 RepID=UPI00283E6CF8|nr:alkyl/aryl-sulfatase [Desulfobulbus sp.]MDR2549531.1 alkyl/aryl-sulfatase [Desulfobulbus sp.]